MAGCAATSRDTSPAAAPTVIAEPDHVGLLGEWRRPGTLSWLRSELSATHVVAALDHTKQLPAHTKLLVVARPQELTPSSWTLIDEALAQEVPLLLLLEADDWRQSDSRWFHNGGRAWFRQRGVAWEPSVLTSLGEPVWEDAGPQYVRAAVPSPTPDVATGLGTVVMREPTELAFMPDATAWRSEPWLVAADPVYRVNVEGADEPLEEEELEEEELPELEEIVMPGYVPPARSQPAGTDPPADVVLAGCQYARDGGERPVMCIVGDLSVFAPSLLLSAARAQLAAEQGLPAANADLLHRLVEHLTR